jgi:hypothetical protein
MDRSKNRDLAIGEERLSTSRLLDELTTLRAGSAEKLQRQLAKMLGEMERAEKRIAERGRECEAYEREVVTQIAGEALRAPQFAELLLKPLTGGAREYVLGDLEEAFYRNVRSYGLRGARRLYWRDALGTAAVFIGKWFTLSGVSAAVLRKIGGI